MEKSECFHLDDEEEGIAYEAKKELQRCSFEDNFEDPTLAIEPERSKPEAKKKFDDSIRTTTSCQEDIRSSMKK